MKVHSRRAFRNALVVGAISALALVAAAPGAGAGLRGAAPLSIVKVVTAPFPAGTTFTATLSCTPSELGDVEAAAEGIIDNDTEDGTDSVTVTFGADGQPTSESGFTFRGSGTCQVTETVNGGAISTTYACEGTNPDDDDAAPTEGVDAFQEEEPDAPVCPSAGPQSSPITVNIVDEEQSATVTITNTPPAAQVAPQVVAQPAFTG